MTPYQRATWVAGKARIRVTQTLSMPFSKIINIHPFAFVGDTFFSARLPHWVFAIGNPPTKA